MVVPIAFTLALCTRYIPVDTRIKKVNSDASYSYTGLEEDRGREKV